MSITPIELRDYVRWRASNANREFSLYDYIYGVFRTQSLPADLLLAVIRLCWPVLISCEGLVLLKEQYSKTKIQELKTQGIDRSQIELWCNMYSVDGMLEEIHGASPEHAAVIAESLRDAWDSKLKRDYPDLEFNVLLMRDEENGDICVTFFQKSDST